MKDNTKLRNKKTVSALSDNLRFGLGFRSLKQVSVINTTETKNQGYPKEYP